MVVGGPIRGLLVKLERGKRGGIEPVLSGLGDDEFFVFRQHIPSYVLRFVTQNRRSDLSAGSTNASDTATDAFIPGLRRADLDGRRT